MYVETVKEIVKLYNTMNYKNVYGTEQQMIKRI